MGRGLSQAADQTFISMTNSQSSRALATKEAARDLSGIGLRLASTTSIAYWAVVLGFQLSNLGRTWEG